MQRSADPRKGPRWYYSVLRPRLPSTHTILINGGERPRFVQARAPFTVVWIGCCTAVVTVFVAGILVYAEHPILPFVPNLPPAGTSRAASRLAVAPPFPPVTARTAAGWIPWRPGTRRRGQGWAFGLLRRGGISWIIAFHGFLRTPTL